MDNMIQARHNFVLAFQYCWNGKEFPIFREISVSERDMSWLKLRGQRSLMIPRNSKRSSVWVNELDVLAIL